MAKEKTIGNTRVLQEKLERKCTHSKLHDYEVFNKDRCLKEDQLCSCLNFNLKSSIFDPFVTPGLAQADAPLSSNNAPDPFQYFLPHAPPFQGANH